jgi:hypothetical protein
MGIPLKKSVFKRLLAIIMCGIFGVLLGFILNVIWFIFTGIIQIRHLDRGPSWLNTVSIGIFIGSILFALVLSQIEFNYIKKDEGLWKNFEGSLIKEFINIFLSFHFIITGYIIGLSVGIFLLFTVWTRFIPYDPISGHFGISWEYVVAKWVIGIPIFLGLISIQLIRIKRSKKGEFVEKNSIV